MTISRIRYLVAYDVADSRRLYLVHKKVEAYAIGGQKSFYECWLNKKEFLLFKQEVNECLIKEEDKVFIFQLHQDTTPLLFGKAVLPQSNEPFLLI